MGGSIDDSTGETLCWGFWKLLPRGLLGTGEKQRAGDGEDGGGKWGGRRGGTPVHGECVVSPSLGVAVALRLVMLDLRGL